MPSYAGSVEAVPVDTIADQLIKNNKKQFKLKTRTNQLIKSTQDLLSLC